MSADKSKLFAQAWRLAGCKEKLVPEYRFCEGRRFRADFAHPATKIAVEIDGGGYAFRGGRHATDADKVKMNLYAERGWAVFHFSPAMLKKDPLGCADQVRHAILGKS
jgi:very-short-patch-repair endonuclease